MRMRKKFRCVPRLAFLVAMFAAFSLSAAPASSDLGRAHKQSAQPSLSSRFLPTRIIPENPDEIARFHVLVSGLRSDSTHHWAMRKGKLEISHDMLQDLDSGSDRFEPGDRSGPGDQVGHGDQSDHGDRGRRVADFLKQTHGLKFRSPGTAYGVFRPDDYWYERSPEWALHNTGTTIGGRPGKPGVDIDIEKVWDKFSGDDSLIIAVVDAGFDFKHPDLKGRNWINAAEANGKPGVDDDNNGFVDDSIGWDFVDNDNLPQDYHGHGTYCSSVIAANFDNAEGIAGIAPKCKIMPVRVLDASGHGSQDDIAKGIRYAVRNGAKVINFSIGGEGDDTAMHSAFQYARDNGVAIVVAAGNDDINIDVTPSFPATYPFDNILVAAAHDQAGLMCSFSNYGKATVDLAAPGEFVLVAGIPDTKEAWKDDFEGPDLSRWSAVGFALSTSAPLESKQSLVWTSGANASAATVDYIDLTGKVGCNLKFVIRFHPANTADFLVIEGNTQGTALWNEIGVIGSPLDSTNVLAFGLQGFDGTKFKLRFRTSTRFSSAGRILKLDYVVVNAPDPNPPTEAVYTVVGGTSIAAPHVAAYVGLQRLACDRMGIAWTRTLALQGVVQEDAFTAKVATGGRLDAYKGLQFYLSSLPDFHVLDSTVLSWRVGETVNYQLELVPAPAQPYKFTVSGLGPAVSVDGAGKFTWIPGPDDVGDHTVTLTAEGPTLFRKRFNLTVIPTVPVSIGTEKGQGNITAGLWRLAGYEFRLRPDLSSGRHWVEVLGTDALGKVRLLRKGWLDASDFQHPLDLGATRVTVAHIRVRVDGQPLAGVSQ